MFRAATFLSALLIIGSFAFLRPGLAAGDAQAAKKIRIGTYDSRAIAVAYAHSRSNVVAEKKVEYEKAKAADDQAKMKELEAWGVQYQRQLHFQGFGRVPVDDLLATVKVPMAELARDLQLEAIAMSYEFTSGEVELVDITDDLVKLYDPSEKTLEQVRAIRKVKPIALTQIADMPANR